MQRGLVIGSLLAMAIALPQGALARSADSTVSASVRETCRLDAPAITLGQDQLSATGLSWEACNSMRGYQIAASTRTLDPDETVMIAYGASSMQLGLSGLTMLVNRKGPTLRQVPIELTASELKAPLTVSMTMTVL